MLFADLMYVDWHDATHKHTHTHNTNRLRVSLRCYTAAIEYASNIMVITVDRMAV